MDDGGKLEKCNGQGQGQVGEGQGKEVKVKAKIQSPQCIYMYIVHVCMNLASLFNYQGYELPV